MVANRNMEDTVVLTLAGYGDLIPARPFVQALTYFLWLLQDLDASVSGNKQGTVEWEISILSKNSPAKIGYRGRPQSVGVSRAHEVAHECVRGIRLLAERPERTERYSDAALSRTQKLARFRHKSFSLEIDVTSDNDEAQSYFRSLMRTSMP